MISPATDGTKALDEGGIWLFRIFDSSFPTYLRTSSRITIGLSSEKTTGIPFLMPSFFSIWRIIRAMGSVWVLEISAIWNRVGSILFAAPILEIIGIFRFKHSFII